MKKSKPPAWINKYRKDYEEGRITREEIFRRENAEREAKQLPKLKFQSVSRAINSLGLSYSLYKPVQEQEQKPSEVPSKPCYSCKYYTKQHVCEYPNSMFKVYHELSDFDKDFSKGLCKLKET